MSQVQTTLQKCPICKIEGTKTIVETLPANAVFIRFVHTDGSTHEYAEYYNMERKITKQPTTVICPKCNKVGRLGWMRRNQNKPWIIRYYLMHEKIKGNWGVGKHDKHRRCYIIEPDQRNLLLKRVGFFVK